MIHFTEGNLLDSKAEVLVNTVNTVGVMGKGIALMFKEKFPQNFMQYAEACKKEEVRVGELFVTQPAKIFGPKWIVNFPTKKHWRNPSKIEWIESGLQELRQFMVQHQIRSIAIPPLGAGHGGLPWNDVRNAIIRALGDLENVHIFLYQPTDKYQNSPKKQGVRELTLARAMIVELIREYESLGFECSLLEVQKLAWFLHRNIERYQLKNPLNLDFEAHKFGPYSDNLRHLLSHLDGSYIHCAKRIEDARRDEPIWTNRNELRTVREFLAREEFQEHAKALAVTIKQIDGFQSPLGMELLATVDWILHESVSTLTIEDIKQQLVCWPAGKKAAERKQKLFTTHMLSVALTQLQSTAPNTTQQSAQLSLTL